ncbi:DEAD/DEAH box helicase [Streptosporangium sp. NBC_01755]|uniref:DEAD/DEAH box helicase n=1 Tax=unclassified Streptosporangium TaxID=2632669 RepID=UPI002DD891B3|nr:MULTISPECIES: DEAD/DEAH box helicase [unclassified Streptosporangium]WSA26265.1 DEAD/DEAH box helicase [Streptosporangium sp. NBC_01810]WSD02307.1 DEAD/DEAH box helicase [Streptosporangium sp. NBC_01755]
MALPLALAGQDIIGQARTGTGKTYAFGVAMLQRVGKPRKNRKKPRGLVVVPTRELAVQVTEDLVTAAGKLGSRILTVYGGRAYEPQIEALKQGVDVIVGTPGRLLDLVKQKHLDLSQIGTLVLDEADRMLDLGFLPDIERIIKLIPAERQTMLFSATLPGEIVALSRRYLTRPTHVRAENNDAEAEATPQTTQFVWRTHRMDKIEIVGRLLQCEGRGLTMIFCETKRACDMVVEQLKERGFAAAAVHGDLGQGQREQALRAFRNGKIDVLVATDVAARGIDVDDVTHVVNYDCPQDEKAYVHRIGRTGRAGKTGVAVTFVEWEDLTRWKVINNALSLAFPEPVETYSTSPHVFSDLGIPEGTKGVLPRANRSRAGLAAEEVEDLGETGRIRSRSPRKGREDDREERRERPARTSRERRRTRGGRTGEETPAPATAEGIQPAEPPVVEIAEVETDVAPRKDIHDDQHAAEAAPRRGRTRRAGLNPEVSLVGKSESPAHTDSATDEPVRRQRRARREQVAEAPSWGEEPVAEFTAEEDDTMAERWDDEPPAEIYTPLPQPEKIIPPSPFAVIFKSPDLASDDDEIAPSAASERVQSRRRPPVRGPQRGNRRPN